VDASLVVAIVAVLISAVSLMLAIRADRRSSRAEGRRLAARPVVSLLGTSPDAAGRRFDLELRNAGQGLAERVRVSLVNESGDVVATMARAGTTLVPGDEAVTVSLIVPESGLPPPPVPFAVWIAWSDGAGDHERRPAGLTVST
jgi:DNA-binding transcriptional LysR family regulator